MAKLSLYYLPLSPPSRAVLITAHLLELELELIPVNLLAGDHLKPEFVKLNPQHTIPLLVDGAAVVYDSHAICTYLVEKYGAKHQQLYPKDLVQRALVDARLHFDTGYLFARVRSLYEPILYAGSTVLQAEKIEYIQRAWPLLEAFLESGDYLCGDRLTLGDVACIASVCSADRIVPIDAATYPKLQQWIERLAKELPHYERDCLDGGVKLQAYVQSKIQYGVYFVNIHNINVHQLYT